MNRVTRKASIRAISAILAMVFTLICFVGCNNSTPQTSDQPSSGGAPSSSAPPQQQGSATEQPGAPAGGAPEGAPAGQTTVVVGLAGDPANIGPFQGMSMGRIGVLYTMYEFLAVTVGGEMHGVLMKDYQKIDDLTYNCEIYDYINDQAGNHLTAPDVVFCYNMLKEAGNPKLGSIDSVAVVSDYVVQFKFNTLSIGDLGALWMECPIVTQAAYEASADQMATDPVSTSAFQCTQYVSGSKIVFTNTHNYWQTDVGKIQITSQANVDVIEFDIITDSSQLTNALKTGAIDVTNWLSDTDVADFENLAGFTVSPIPDNTTYFLMFNCDAQQGVFANNELYRQAIAYAIDCQQIIDGTFGGNGNAARTWGNTNYSDYVQNWLSQSYFDTDPAKAKQLMADAGAVDLNLRLMITSGDANTRIATIIQAQLAQLGINLTISPYDNQLFNQYKYEPDQWDLILDQGASTSYLVNVWKLAWDRNGYVHGGTENFVHDDQLQNLLESAMDVDKHNDATMDAFHQYLKDQCYGIGLLQPFANIAHSAKITRIVVDARGQVIPGACDYAA